MYSTIGPSRASSGPAIPDEPTCRHTTVPVSTHASITGSHQPRVQRRVAELLGLLRQAHGTEPPCARCGGSPPPPSCGIGEVGDPDRDEATPGERAPTPRGTSRSRPARMPDPARDSEHPEYTEPQNPVIWLGKLTEAVIPPRSMSATRAAGSKHARPHLRRSAPAPSARQSLDRPATALSPTCG